MITFEQVTELGFKRIEYTDPIYYKKHGRYPVDAEKVLAKVIAKDTIVYIIGYWDGDDRTVTIYHQPDDCNQTKNHTFKKFEHLKIFCNLLETNNKSDRYDYYEKG